MKDVDEMSMEEIEQLSQKELDDTYEDRYSSGQLTRDEMGAA